ncbi:MAG: biopolymer transporter ExbD [Verrucomicrobiota bacterium]
MRLTSPIPHKKARIEIIPLIDIMFFLLASFMMVSLSQTHMKGIRVNLPSGPPPPGPPQKDYVSIQVREGNVIYVDGNPMVPDDLHGYLFRLHQANPELKVSISAEMMALHGDVIRVLDEVRTVKITKVGYQIRAAQKQGAPSGAPGAPPPPPPPKR